MAGALAASPLDLELLEVARYIRQNGGMRGTLRGERIHVCDYLKSRFYVQETQQPIVLYGPQAAILDFALMQHQFRTVLWSTVKKMGKTTIASAVARWVCETWGPFAEVYCMANDMEQARGRIYAGIQKSLALTPQWNPGKREMELPDGRIEWREIMRNITHEPTHGTIRAVSNDYKGEAGSNPTATFWSETWGLRSEDDLRMWYELTPVATRERSMRWVETYAGYKNEPGILYELYTTGTSTKEGAVRLDCHSFPNWPAVYMAECDCGSCCGHTGPGLPLFVNEGANMFVFWDQDERARRAPWVQGDRGTEYYSEQQRTLSPEQYERLHLNHWISSTEQFLPIEWWDACFDPSLPPLDSTTPVVIAVDAAVSNDCCALVGCTRRPGRSSDPAIRLSRIFYPPVGGKFDYSTDIMLTLAQWCSKYNVVEITYDPYQLHGPMTDFRRETGRWCREFSQASERMQADKALFDVIRDARLIHQCGPDEREHIQNADRKTNADNDTKFRLVKRTEKSKIDFAVAASMAVSECLRLDLA